MNEQQKLVIRCALADLIGSYQDWTMKGGPDSYHDWESHLETIYDVAKMFDLIDEVPEEL
jgi:hypothetical protein